MKAILPILTLCVSLTACHQTSPADDVPAPEAPAVVDPAPSEAGPLPVPQADDSVAGQGFSKSLELQGIGFDVVEADGVVTVTPSGLEISNEPMDRAIEGHVSDAEVADINADGSPEVYVFVAPDTEGGAASLVAYSSNNRKSLSDIHLPPLADDGENAKGYKGGDELALVENRISRRFPVIGSDGAPTGKSRQLTYRLSQGESGWVLVLDKSSEY